MKFLPMKQFRLTFLFSFFSLLLYAQKEVSTGAEQHTLLWKISGNGLQKPSYLFGTIHMICGDGEVLSDTLKKIISRSDDIYLEADINDFTEMMGAFSKMMMKGDTTLADLLTGEEYEKVKTFFEEKNPMLPFTMLESLKPMLIASMLSESALECEPMQVMEQVISDLAEKNGKKIAGLETLSYQAEILDEIPYQLQAKQLIEYIDNINSNRGEDKELLEIMEAYWQQDLSRIEAITARYDEGISQYTELLLYKRNRNWVEKLKTLMPAKSLLIAVGAGHLPGEKGVINLLRKEGYTVLPVENKISKTRTL
jgi:uncharacterized protein YbaP (TraB family)